MGLADVGTDEGNTLGEMEGILEGDNVGTVGLLLLGSIVGCADGW